jgi:hypothetical protein
VLEIQKFYCVYWLCPEIKHTLHNISVQWNFISFKCVDLSPLLLCNRKNTYFPYQMEGSQNGEMGASENRCVQPDRLPPARPWSSVLLKGSYIPCLQCAWILLLWMAAFEFLTSYSVDTIDL